MPTRASRIFARAILAVSFIATLITLYIYWHIYGYAKLFGDYPTFRDAAIHARDGALASIYDLANAQSLMVDGKMKKFTFFLNPPTGLFVVWPLAYMAFLPGLIFWTLVQFLVLAFALSTPYFRNLFAPSDDASLPTPLLVGVLCFSFGIQNIFYGQLGVLCCALFLLVMGWRHSHPIWAGIVLGLFSFKPQLGVLLPLLLLAERNWKALGMAVITSLLMIALTLLFWGPQLWIDYKGMVQLRSEFLATTPMLLFMICMSVYAALRNYAFSTESALWLQAAVALWVVLLIWKPLRKAVEADKIQLLILGTYLVTPYSLLYDMTLLAISCGLLLRSAEADVAWSGERLALMLLIVLPFAALILQIINIPYSVVAIGFTLIVARMLTRFEQHG